MSSPPLKEEVSELVGVNQQGQFLDARQIAVLL